MKSNRLVTGVIALFVILMSPVVSHAGSGNTGSGGMGFFMIGGMKMNIDDLNSRLVENGYTKISDTFLSMGGGGHAIMGRLILGGEGNSVFNNSENNDFYDYSLNGASGYFNIGYVAYATPAFRLYPILGLGGGGMTMKISEKSISPSFDEILQNPKRTVEMSTGGFLMNIALGADYMIAMEQGKEGAGGFIVGLRAGYVMTPIKGDWTMDDTKLSGGPDIGMTGFYLRLLIGGGGYGN